MTHILIVDDKEENLYYLQALLTGNGCTVDIAHHGAEALVIARQSLPDIIVSDLLMPVMDGYTLLRHWKADARLKQIPFVVYTATYTEPEDERLAFSLGADAFILKPAEPEDFLAQVLHVKSRVSVISPLLPNVPIEDENGLLKNYSETLIRKLEEKTLQLEQTNRALEQDIAERKAAEDKVQLLAFYDPLTHLPNRRLLLDRLQHTFALSTRHHNHGAVLFIDLDQFKTLNDTKGHKVGDLLLVEVSKRLQSCVTDGNTVARLGGDEFVIILEELSEEAAQAAVQVKTVCDKILKVVSQVYSLDGFEYHTSTSIGITLFQNQEIGVDELLKRADIAMYQAKGAGRNTMRFYDPAMQAALEARTALGNDLHRGLTENQFVLHYQPQVDAHHDLLGAEALIRWLHPQRGLVSPLEFIPLAEEMGLITLIGQWVLETACAQLKRWEAHPQTSKLTLAVNVSARQFHQSNFTEQVHQTLLKHEIKPDRLKLELTESVVLDNIEDTIIKMQALRKVGVRFSMDDFGTGYSSLSYLTQLPLDQLKIDQSFVRNLGVNNRDAVIVQTIIGMASNLEIEVIAEGVETKEQWLFLEQHGCGMYQGYLFGKPCPIEEFESALNPSRLM